ncbi:MAG: sigma-70 family RNA polymerase sigma factor [Acidobacteriota bacterium]
MLEPRDERRLLDALATGDRQAAETLVERTYAQTYRSLCRLTGGDAELAADLTQDTYRRAWIAIADFDRRSRFTTWLFRIAYTTFLNHIRRPKRVESIDDHAIEHIERDEREPNAEDRAHENERDSRLRRAVLALPDNLRFTVTARYWGEQSVADIAKATSVTGAAIRKRLKKAHHILQLALEEDAA